MCVNILIQVAFDFTFGKYVICYVHLQRASLVCDSNPVVASQTRFAVYRMKRRICANLNLTYSQSVELGLSPDMFFKWIGGVFPTENRSCFRVLCPCLCDGRFMSFTAKRRICARLNIGYS